MNHVFSDFAARQAFASWFKENHPGRDLGFGDIEGRTALTSSKGLRLGWILKGEGRLSKSGDKFLPGDQWALTPDRSIEVEGSFSWAWIEDHNWQGPLPPQVQPLMSLPDTSGGCNVSPGAFRRLQVTWNPKDVGPQKPDGMNRLNSHVVNIEERFSTAHFHPHPARGGGESQEELYFVLDPAPYSIPGNGEPHVLVYPDPLDPGHYDRISLKPGDAAYFPPGTGHRGMNVFVNVVALPGFKPNNEIPIPG